MRLSKHDLFQMDDEWLKKLPAELLLEVSKRLLQDVKELQDRLNQNPGNSSRPPSTKAPRENPENPGTGRIRGQTTVCPLQIAQNRSSETGSLRLRGRPEVPGVALRPIAREIWSVKERTGSGLSFCLFLMGATRGVLTFA